MIDGIEQKKCTGCMMCADICPNLAISYLPDQKGFWYPEVDHNKCCECSRCINTCPGLTGKLAQNHNPEVYSAWLKDDEKRLASTSGGVYYALAKTYIQEGKYIVGCQYTDHCKGASHVISNSEDGLEKIMGSKYFQSDTAGIYKEIKTLLERDEEVLFCGTPCQCAALNHYLGKPYSNLITIDFICRGVTSPKVYRKYISEMEERFHSTVESVHMKDKRAGWQSLGFSIKFLNGKEYFRKGKDDLWIEGYLRESLYTRPSCEDCRHKVLPRVSDLSLGDFWGIQEMKQEDLLKGISMVMVNSSKGEDLFHQIKGEIFYEKRSLQEAIKGNPCITTNVCKSGKSELFFESLNEMSVSKAIQKSLKRHEFLEAIRMNQFIHKVRSILLSVDLVKLIYYNFFCQCIIREKGCYLIPYKNCVINLDKSARIYINRGNVQLGLSKLRGSKAETFLTMRENSRWFSNGKAELFYHTQIDIQKNAIFRTGYFSANCGTVIVCAKKITLGENIMMGRNIVVYDSDHHQMIDRNGYMINYDEEVTIEDNVWLTSNVTVLRGVTIGKGSIIAAQTVIKKDLPPYSLAEGNPVVKVIQFNKATSWSRESPHRY